MKLTIIQVGQTPEPMLNRFDQFPPLYQDLLLASGEKFSFEIANIIDGEDFPSISQLEGIIITGSAFAVYDNPDWIDVLRDFIRQVYRAKIPMLGICFGHQIMADALGGKVEKSDKGWGIGRHVYQVRQKLNFMKGIGDEIAIVASHQDQVIIAPSEAEVFLSSNFTPNAGLIYKNGAAISMQPHPEFAIDYAKALVDVLDDGQLAKGQAKEAYISLQSPLDRIEIGASLAKFFKR